jgi:hypothetical protein
MIGGLLRATWPNTVGFLPDTVGTMNEHRLPLVAPISAEMLVSTDLDDVYRWLVECHYNPVRLDAVHLPAIGQHTWLSVGPPITARRAVLCTLWLVELVEGGGCLVAGHPRFVAHPTTSDVKVAFDGRTAAAPRTEVPSAGGNVARQLLVQVAAAIERTQPLAQIEMAS